VGIWRGLWKGVLSGRDYKTAKTTIESCSENEARVVSEGIVLWDMEDSWDLLHPVSDGYKRINDQ
jgi:hypothetical protein